MNVISVKTLINGQYAICCEDGTKLYEKIKDCLERKQAIAVDFSGIKICASPFLSQAIGRLFADFEAEDAQKVIDNIVNLNPDFQRTLNRCVNTSRKYYGERAFAQKVDSVIQHMASDNYDWNCCY
jgi:STAS-like domain of unknown function (DUF4325)